VFHRPSHRSTATIFGSRSIEKMEPNFKRKSGENGRKKGEAKAKTGAER
jgi:hypothetical protein